jgi:hypothetical protein
MRLLAAFVLVPALALAAEVTVGDVTVDVPVSKDARQSTGPKVWEATDPATGWKWRFDRIGDGMKAYPSSAQTQAAVLKQFGLTGQTEVVDVSFGDRPGFLFGAADPTYSTRFCFRGHNGSIYLLGVWFPRGKAEEAEPTLVFACKTARFADATTETVDPLAIAGFRFGGDFDYALPRGWTAEQGAVTFSDPSGTLAGVAMRQPKAGNPLAASDGLELQQAVRKTGFLVHQRELLEAAGLSGWMFDASREMKSGVKQEFVLAYLRGKESLWYVQVPKEGSDYGTLSLALRGALKQAKTKE